MSFVFFPWASTKDLRKLVTERLQKPIEYQAYAISYHGRIWAVAICSVDEDPKKASEGHWKSAIADGDIPKPVSLADIEIAWSRNE